MKSFKDFAITRTTTAFTGDKIKISKIINREIIVLGYKIEASKFEGKRLDLQIELNGTKQVTWSGSKSLMDDIVKVPEDGFPFKTTIVRENEWYEFT
jgi:hypothetical protein